jgi:phosphate transport system permease protein
MAISPAPRRVRESRDVSDQPTPVDRLFGYVTSAAGATVLVVMILVGLFLLLRSRDALAEMGGRFFTTVEWRPDIEVPHFGVRGLITGTVLVGLIAFSIAVPIGTCAGLFITEFASPRWRSVLTSLVDLLAAIPSLLYGLWGLVFLQDKVAPLSAWLARHFDWIPLFRVDDEPDYIGTMFIAGMVVSLMVIPIVASITREVFSQTPQGEKEAALALGGTRWGMVRKVVIPFGRGGIIGASMLGLGRALGETIAVSLLLPQVPEESIRVLQHGGATVSGFIVQRAGGSDLNVSGLMGAGLVLFVMTLTTNLLASTIIARSRSGAGVDA